MKASELMIGDWVLYNPNVFIDDEYEPPKDCYPTKISCGEDIDLAIEDCYSPIPLTEEILEKNGFSHIMYSDAYYSIMIGDTYVELRKYENMAVWFNWKENNDGVYADYILPMPQFVHELQHALRLCNIEKEIEL